jgi:hypothetical protein
MREAMIITLFAALAMFLASGAIVLLCLAARIGGLAGPGRLAAIQMKKSIDDAETAGSERAMAGRIRV